MFATGARKAKKKNERLAQLFACWYDSNIFQDFIEARYEIDKHPLDVALRVYRKIIPDKQPAILVAS
jgi:hypothetical protein